MADWEVGERERESRSRRCYHTPPPFPGARLLTHGWAEPPSIRTLAVSGPVGRDSCDSCWECALEDGRTGEWCTRANEPNPLDNRAARATRRRHNSNIWPMTISVSLDTCFDIWVTLNFDLSRSLKVKCDLWFLRTIEKKIQKKVCKRPDAICRGSTIVKCLLQ